MATRLAQRVVGKTADYQIKFPMDAPGTIFTTRGATGPVTFTLPAPTKQHVGVWYEFFGVADQSVFVKVPAAGQMTTLNNLTNTTFAALTAGELIGASVLAECVEAEPFIYRWVMAGTAVGHTFTSSP